MRVAAVVSILATALAFAATAAARMPPLYRSCKAVNAKYPHGIGRAHAHDKTSGVPVNTFVRSDHLYALAMSYNRGLDRDKDGIACEKA